MVPLSIQTATRRLRPQLGQVFPNQVSQDNSSDKAPYSTDSSLWQIDIRRGGAGRGEAGRKETPPSPFHSSLQGLFWKHEAHIFRPFSPHHAPCFPSTTRKKQSQ